MTEETSQDVKIGKLEVRVEGVEVKVDKILDNHLPHIQAKVDSVHDRQMYWGGAIAILIFLSPLVWKVLDKFF